MILNSVFLGDDEYVIEATTDGETVSRVRADGSGEFVDAGTEAAVIDAARGSEPVRPPHVGRVA